jgi:hypothetical protein
MFCMAVDNEIVLKKYIVICQGVHYKTVTNMYIYWHIMFHGWGTLEQWIKIENTT